jgi:hypothetical protein
MKKEEYSKRLQQHNKDFDELWAKIVQDTNDFISLDSQVTTSDQIEGVEDIVDNFCLSGAWIQDRLDGKSNDPCSEKYKGSLSEKIGKALGYNF